MQRHISKVVSACFYHLRWLPLIQNYVSRDVVAQPVMSLVISHYTVIQCIQCSPAYLHPHWRLYNVYRTLLLD